MAEIKRIQIKIGNKKVIDKLVDEFAWNVREACGPIPPCVICKKESKIAIDPFGAYFCESHSDEEISKWFKARGINLEIKMKR